MRGDNKTGRLGEIYAAKYLASKGYTILETNYKTHIAEVDIIALAPDGCICFAEVKTRKNKLYGRGSDFIFKSKMDKMILGARCYMSSHKTNSEVRFDVIEVYGELLPGGFAVSELNHIENAFEA